MANFSFFYLVTLNLNPPFAVVDQHPRCEDDFVLDPSTEYCYKLIQTPRTDWTRGRAVCQAMEADLLLFDNLAEAKGFYTLMKSGNIFICHISQMPYLKKSHVYEKQYK